MFRMSIPSKRQEKGVERARKRQKGFSLIEMLAVVIIMVVIAAVGFVLVNNQIEKSRVNTDAANARTVADAVQRYIMDKGGAPANVAALVSEGYLAQAPKDPWGNGDEYKIEVDNPDVTISPINNDKNAPIVLKNALE